MQYHIGLDFGTYQTKACVNDLANKVHEFFRFPSTGGFFLPSCVALKPDGTFSYGRAEEKPVVRAYYYFKIASAEDEEFHLETFEVKRAERSAFYKNDDFSPYTPEFLSVLYLTHVLFTIKEHYQARGVKKEEKKGFFSKLLTPRVEKPDIKFTVQLGIPTEWSQMKNLRRKRKFENILIISELLQQHYKTLSRFLQTSADELVAEVKSIYRSVHLRNAGELKDRLNELGLSVFPETAAGLTFIIKTKQLRPGYYAIMDIGGGTTDISFFTVESGHSIKYLASESYIIAANNVYKQLVKDGDSVASLHAAEKEVQLQLSSNAWQTNQPLKTALDKVRGDLNKMVYKLFHRRVYHFRHNMVEKYSEQPILLYGGGAKLPVLDGGTVLIYDNGNRDSITIPHFFMEKQQIDQYTSIINVLPEDGSWKPHLSMLVVALGLSYIKPDSFTDWFGEEEYQPRDGRPPRRPTGAGKWQDDNGQMVQHPQNEDYYLYDILASKWSKS